MIKKNITKKKFFPLNNFSFSHNNFSFSHNNFSFSHNNFSFSHNNLLVKNFIHSSAILYSNVDSKILEQINRLGQERVSDLQLIKYQENVVDEDIKDLNISSISEIFPWFLDEEGKNIEYNKPIKLFDGVKLIS